MTIADGLVLQLERKGECMTVGQELRVFDRESEGKGQAVHEDSECQTVANEERRRRKRWREDSGKNINMTRTKEL